MLSLTEIAGKAVGAAKAAGAALSGYRGIFRTLKREHGEVSVLLMRIATEKDGHARARLFPLVTRELLGHARAEDAEFYSVLAEHESTRALVVRLEAEHERIEQLLTELSGLPSASPAWAERFRELQRAVQEHVDVEENQMFPRARRILSPELTEEMDRRYKLEKVRVGAPPPEPPPAQPLA
ncbi:MAG TPA: hemerythrin domain-containing protein [Kofleriaceae bacterium]|nr:hemerythrin domain-containing protein [Kofleriaceae bacterium]